MDNQKDNNYPASRGNSPFFEKDRPFTYVHKKTEKLATALYMVTNLFSDSEPMKWTLRKKVADLLSFTVGYKDIPSSHYFDFIHNIKTRVFELISLLEVSAKSGLVSDMNFSILREEFTRLIEALDTAPTRDAGLSHDSFPKNFFDIGSMGEKARGGYSIKDTHHIVKDNVQEKKTNRQQVILDFIKKKKEVTIKDISSVIQNYSEKTIQRELISLIDNGLVKKVGQRRWSRYSLVTNTPL